MVEKLPAVEPVSARRFCCKVGDGFRRGVCWPEEDSDDAGVVDFKGRHFTAEVILWTVRWYLMFPVSYRDLELMLADRGVAVDHTTIFRWI